MGENPAAVATLGINVYRLRMRAVLLGGVFAGMGGAVMCLSSANVFVNDMSAGSGFKMCIRDRLYIAYLFFKFYGRWRIMSSRKIPPIEKGTTVCPYQPMEETTLKGGSYDSRTHANRHRGPHCFAVC